MLPIFLFFTKLGAVNFTSGMLLRMANLLIYNYEFRNEVPELVYAYNKTSKKDNIKNLIILLLTYFCPIIGSLEVLANIVTIPLSIKGCQQIKKNPSSLITLKNNVRNNVEFPNERLKELKLGVLKYKEITDSLKMEGLNETEINKFMKEAKKADKYIDKDNKKQIAINKQRVENLQLLEPIGPAVKKPYEVYKYTLDKAIKKAEVKRPSEVYKNKLDKAIKSADVEKEDDLLYITTSRINYNDPYDQKFEEDNKSEEKPKLKVKRFELK